MAPRRRVDLSSHFQARDAPVPTRLLGAAENPFSSEFVCYLFMRHRTAGRHVRLSTLDRLNHVQVIQDVFETAVVRQPIQKSPDGLLCADVFLLVCVPLFSEHLLKPLKNGCNGAGRQSP